MLIWMEAWSLAEMIRLLAELQHNVDVLNIYSDVLFIYNISLTSLQKNFSKTL